MEVRPDVVIAMPAFNEEGTLGVFLNEIAEAFSEEYFQLVVVNDCSTDRTKAVLDELSLSLPLSHYTNQRNSGHGPATLKSLKLATALRPRYVISCDGDGHITGATLWTLYEHAVGFPNPTIIEGVRTHRSDPWFRKLTSAATRAIVQKHSGRRPLDANTPFRIYPLDVLTGLLTNIPDDHMTPNLMMSSMARRGSYSLAEIPFQPYTRDGSAENGSTWKQKWRFLPSRRFLGFLIRATAQWVLPKKPVAR